MSGQALNDLVAEFNTEYAKFSEKGNAAAATRARGKLQEITKVAKSLRVAIQEAKNAAKEAKASS